MCVCMRECVCVSVYACLREGKREIERKRERKRKKDRDMHTHEQQVENLNKKMEKGHAHTRAGSRVCVSKQGACPKLLVCVHVQGPVGLLVGVCGVCVYFRVSVRACANER